jgi:hypothetical protein
MLVGLVVKNGIIPIEYAQQLHREGRTESEAIPRGRARPPAADPDDDRRRDRGLLPLASESARASSPQRPLAIAVIGGSRGLGRRSRSSSCPLAAPRRARAPVPRGDMRPSARARTLALACIAAASGCRATVEEPTLPPAWTAEDAARPLSRRDCIDLALHSAPTSTAWKARILAARAGLEQAEALPNPALSLGWEDFGLNAASGGSAVQTTLSLAMSLEDLFSRKRRAAAASHDLEAEEANPLAAPGPPPRWRGPTTSWSRRAPGRPTAARRRRGDQHAIVGVRGRGLGGSMPSARTRSRVVPGGAGEGRGRSAPARVGLRVLARIRSPDPPSSIR